MANPTVASSNPTEGEDRIMRDYTNTNSSRQHQHQQRITRKAAIDFTTSSSSSSSSVGNDWKTLPDRLETLVGTLQNWQVENGSPQLTCSFSKDPKESKRLAMTAAIMASSNYGSVLTQFRTLFRASLEFRQHQHQQQQSSTMEEEEDLDDNNNNNYQHHHLFANGEDLVLFEHLRALGWIRTNGILMSALNDTVQRAILQKVRTTIAGDFEEEDGFYDSIQQWCHSTVEGWLHDMVGPKSFRYDNWSNKLTVSCAQCFCLCRIEEIFDMVCEWESSRPAVLELRTVLEKTKMHSILGDALRGSLVRRLCHPGANTSQIIDCYINTIKVLREIDPSDRLLEVVTAPVRSYLRARNDTVRCIITSLTDAEVGGDLYEELRRQDARPLEAVRDDSDDEEECPTFDWQPAPSITNPRGCFLANSGGGKAGGGGSGGSSDILSMLVSIYGSKELFVNEYRVMLADKLLANLDFTTDKEVHTLELLKLRFGEMSMRNCEIMIKDMDDSKRAVANIHSTIKAATGGKKPTTTPAPVVDSAIISHIFWPTLQNDQLKHHPRIQADLDQFSAEFCRLKNPRRLIWLNQLGSVQLELDVMEEGPSGEPIIETREFNCTPLLATLISHFEDRQVWTAEDLSNETGISETIIQKRMGFWVSNRVVKIVPSAQSSSVVYQVASQEHMTSGTHDMDSAMMDLDHGDSQAVALLAQEEEEMGVYESYIVGMLTNLGSLPLDKIHSMLKMYVSGSDVKFNKTPQQLSAFLKHLCKQEKLECGPDGMYKLFKK